LSLLLAAGCAGWKDTPPATAPVSTQVSRPVVELPAIQIPAPRPAAAEAPEPRAAPTATTPPVQPVRPPAPALNTAPKSASTPVAARPATPPLDLKSLETRLRETKAVGVFTKLSLKNQVDDLLNQFRAYHKSQAPALAALRQSYNLLMLKVLALLQDTDPALARDIVASREAIWGILADPKKFNESNLMAGVLP
jgi:hypothetical protein